MVVFRSFLRLLFFALAGYVTAFILLYLWMIWRLAVYRRLSDNDEWLQHT